MKRKLMTTNDDGIEVNSTDGKKDIVYPKCKCIKPEFQIREASWAEKYETVKLTTKRKCGSTTFEDNDIRSCYYAFIDATIECPQCNKVVMVELSDSLTGFEFIEKHMCLTSNNTGFKRVEQSVEILLCINARYGTDFPIELSVTIINSMWFLDLTGMASHIEEILQYPYAREGYFTTKTAIAESSKQNLMDNYTYTQIPNLPTPPNMTDILIGYNIGSMTRILDSIEYHKYAEFKSPIRITGEFLISAIRLNGRIVSRYKKIVIPGVEKENTIQAQMVRQPDGLYIKPLLTEYNQPPVRIQTCEPNDHISLDHIFVCGRKGLPPTING